MGNACMLIEEIEMPNILVNGIQYELFCEFAAKSGNTQSVYVDKKKGDVIVIDGNVRAIADFFSTNKENVKVLFDYIESSMTRKNGLICFESESFPALLKTAIDAGGRYPLIQNEIEPSRQFSVSRALLGIHPQHSLSVEFREKLREHTVNIEIRTRDSDCELFSDFENSVDEDISSEKLSLASKIESAEARAEDKETSGGSKSINIEPFR